jgi:hypothetical protein
MKISSTLLAHLSLILAKRCTSLLVANKIVWIQDAYYCLTNRISNIFNESHMDNALLDSKTESGVCDIFRRNLVVL